MILVHFSIEMMKLLPVMLFLDTMQMPLPMMPDRATYDANFDVNFD
jgi:hypothetical protein